MLTDAWYRIQSMAFSRSRCEDKITELSAPIFEHLLKVLLWEDPTNLDKHTDDIDTWFRKVWEIEPKGGARLKEIDYFTWLWAEKKYARSKDAYDKVVRSLSSRYGSLPVRAAPDEVWHRLPVIYKTASRLLANSQLPTCAELGVLTPFQLTRQISTPSP